MFVLSLVVLLALLEWRVTGPNLGTPYNGYGALEGTLWRASANPMRGRVLLAWLVGWLPEPARLIAYQAAKWALCWGALATFEGLAGPPATVLLALLIAATFRFDYWDCYAELLGVCLCLTGEPVRAALGALLWGLSRETVLLAPALAWPAGLAGPAVWLLVKVWQGSPPLYCKRWTLRALNVPDLLRLPTQLDSGMLLSILWTVATPVVVLASPLPQPLGAAAWAPLLWIVAGWTMARARETRVFMPAALWLAAGLGGAGCGP